MSRNELAERIEKMIREEYSGDRTPDPANLTRRVLQEAYK